MTRYLTEPEAWHAIAAAYVCVDRTRYTAATWGLCNALDWLADEGHITDKTADDMEIRLRQTFSANGRRGGFWWRLTDTGTQDDARVAACLLLALLAEEDGC